MSTNNAVNVGLSGSTGTGNFVGSTSPTIVTPQMASIYGVANNLQILQVSSVASGVNFLDITNAIMGNPPALSAIGSDTNIALQVQGKGTSGVRIKGFQDASSASSGYVGEVISSAVADNTVSFSTGVAANVTSISLTAGDWDVVGFIVFVQAATTTANAFVAAINTTSATLPSTSSPTISTPTTRIDQVSFGANGRQCLPVSKAIINVSSTTTVYLVGRATFAIDTCTGGGVLIARRVR